jgi:hypothetical protein
LRRSDLSLGLGQRGTVIAIVDPSDHIAGCDVLVVGDRNGAEVARDFRRNSELTGSDERVIGRFILNPAVEFAPGGESPALLRDERRSSAASRSPGG